MPGHMPERRVQAPQILLMWSQPSQTTGCRTTEKVLQSRATAVRWHTTSFRHWLFYVLIWHSRSLGYYKFMPLAILCPDLAHVA
jgi:hypothetical protein